MATTRSLLIKQLLFIVLAASVAFVMCQKDEWSEISESLEEVQQPQKKDAQNLERHSLVPEMSDTEHGAITNAIAQLPDNSEVKKCFEGNDYHFLLRESNADESLRLEVRENENGQLADFSNMVWKVRGKKGDLYIGQTYNGRSPQLQIPDASMADEWEVSFKASRINGDVIEDVFIIRMNDPIKGKVEVSGDVVVFDPFDDDLDRGSVTMVLAKLSGGD